jgi:hypothetical protein
MLKGIAVFTLIIGFLCPAGVFAQSEAVESRDRTSVPEILRRPQRGEAPRYPIDLVIGSLNQAEVSDRAYRFAQDVLGALTRGNRDAPAFSAMNSVSREAIFSSLTGINPRTYRLGSGREEADGAVSFLVRFMGREQGIAGELYIRPDEAGEDQGPRWQFDDLILEEVRNLNETAEGAPFDFPPYERFF